MTRAQAKALAAEKNRDGSGITYVPAKQHWRAGTHWYVRGSDGSGTFHLAKDGGERG